MRNWVSQCQGSVLATERRLLSSKGIYCSFLTNIEKQMHSCGGVSVVCLPISSYEDRCSLRGQAAFLALYPACAEKKNSVEQTREIEVSDAL